MSSASLSSGKSKSSQPPTDDKTSQDGNNTGTPISDAGDAEKQTQSTPTQAEWISGFKLWIIMTGITLVCFLMLLDISILSTVSGISECEHSYSEQC